jgi:hypothetical protein
MWPLHPIAIPLMNIAVFNKLLPKRNESYNTDDANP